MIHSIQSKRIYCDGILASPTHRLIKNCPNLLPNDQRRSDGKLSMDANRGKIRAAGRT
ncbi:hypothetical protein KIN20_004336 [Parelaphostrongylus tenuis]|uniref:Uncharacterized protein n=1 Tax=Parelaphostrongylus tenuis TaxID=148309 RepID=A0AAD5QF26_PARTN|nr:hypothetical protein KIN20_004336 [Parelaphostrongylus tenuis]